MAPDSMDPVFQALAHPARRRILDILKASPGTPVGAVCEHFDMSRIAVMKHLKILEEAQLVVSEKAGRSRLLYHNTVPIQMIYDRWTTEYSQHWAGRLTGLKYKIESQLSAADSSKTTPTRKGKKAPKRAPKKERPDG